MITKQYDLHYKKRYPVLSGAVLVLYGVLTKTNIFSPGA